MEVYLTQREVAELLHLSQRTVERLRLRGDGPRFVKASRRVLYRRSDVETWTADRTFGSTAEVTQACRRQSTDRGRRS